MGKNRRQLSRPWRFYLLASRSLYAVTDQRVLIVIDGGQPAIHAIPFSRIRDVVARRFRDGTGHVFLPVRWFSNPAAGRSLRLRFTEGLWGIDDPSGVVSTIRALRPRRQAQRRPTAMAPDRT